MAAVARMAAWLACDREISMAAVARMARMARMAAVARDLHPCSG